MPKHTSTGRHAAKVTAAEFGQSEKGTPHLQLSFETAEGSINGWLYLSEKALPGSLRTLRNAFKFDDNFETLVDQVVGKDCLLVIEAEEYEGAERIKVKWINSPSSSAPIEDKDAFLKSISAKAACIPKEAPKAGNAPTRPAPAPRPTAKPAPKVAATEDEDRPF